VADYGGSNAREQIETPAPPNPPYRQNPQVYCSISATEVTRYISLTCLTDDKVLCDCTKSYKYIKFL
jgi:hypothetical protein